VRTARRTALLVLIGLVICGCAGRPPAAPEKAATPPLPPIDENLLALAPAAYSQVARMDVALLRASPLWGASDLALTEPTLAELRGASAQDPLLAIDELLVTGGDPEGTGSDELLVVAKGRIDAKALAASLAAKRAPGDAGPEGAGALAAVALTERTIAIGTPRIVAQAEALSRREGSSMLKNPALADLALGPGTAIVWRYRHGDERLALERLRLGTIRNIKWGGHAISGDGALRIDTGLAMEIGFALDDAKTAAKARRDLKRSVSSLAGNAIVRLLGVASMLARITVGGENERVEIRAALTAADVQEIQKLFERIAQIRELMADDSEEEEAPVALDPPVLERGKKP
jgi:hypothetical protein